MLNKTFLLLTIITLPACSAFNNTSEPKPQNIYSFSNNITEKGLYEDLAVLAHDSLQGRETGTPGEEKAARYLSERYQDIGLTPAGDNNTFFQHFDLVQPAVESFEYTVKSISSDSLIDHSTFNKEQTGNFVTIFGGNTPVEGPIHFAGAGMHNPEEGINHYPNDLSGKWVLIFYIEDQTNMRYLQTVLSSGEALGAIIITDNDVADFKEEAKAQQTVLGQARGLSLKYLQEKNERPSPAFNRIHPELAASLFGFKNLDALTKLQENILNDPLSFEARELDFSLKHDPTVNENTVTTKNIVAYLEGNDPQLKNEVVVLSSHYDHVGIGAPDSTGDEIYNGADDDGSGTAATLQVAQAMMEAKKAGQGPKRSVIFLNVTAEEKGLLGSRYYSDHPFFSMDNTVANINIDMIGRVDPKQVQAQDSNYVYIIGGEIISSGLDSLTQMANVMGPHLDLNKRYNDLDDPNQFYRRSDHWNFGRFGVPFVFFFTGVHEDYHRPSDHIEKITFSPYEKRTRLIYNLTALIANSPERPEVDNQEFINKTQVNIR